MLWSAVCLLIVLNAFVASIRRAPSELSSLKHDAWYEWLPHSRFLGLHTLVKAGGILMRLGIEASEQRTSCLRMRHIFVVGT